MFTKEEVAANPDGELNLWEGVISATNSTIGIRLIAGWVAGRIEQSGQSTVVGSDGGIVDEGLSSGS